MNKSPSLLISRFCLLIIYNTDIESCDIIHVMCILLVFVCASVYSSWKHLFWSSCINFFMHKHLHLIFCRLWWQVWWECGFFFLKWDQHLSTLFQTFPLPVLLVLFCAAFRLVYTRWGPWEPSKGTRVKAYVDVSFHLLYHMWESLAQINKILMLHEVIQMVIRHIYIYLKNV